MKTLQLETLIAVIPLASAALYLMGFAYHQSYLSVYGVDEFLFPLPIEKSWLFGFWVVLAEGLIPMMFAFFSMLSLLLAIMVITVATSNEKIKAHFLSVIEKVKFHRKSKTKAPSAPEPTMVEITEKTGILSLYIGVPFFIMAFIGLAILLASKSGQQQAKKEMADFQIKQTHWVEIEHSGQPTPTQAKLIFCSEKLCAFWQGEKSIILQTDKIDRMTAQPANPNKASSPAPRP